MKPMPPWNLHAGRRDLVARSVNQAFHDRDQEIDTILDLARGDLVGVRRAPSDAGCGIIAQRAHRFDLRPHAHQQCAARRDDGRSKQARAWGCRRPWIARGSWQRLAACW